MPAPPRTAIKITCAAGRGYQDARRVYPGRREHMAWTWRFEKNDGTVVAWRGMPKESFSSQGDAESWVGEDWRSLLESGVDQVTLRDEARAEYGPMSPPPAEESRDFHDPVKIRGELRLSHNSW